MRTGAATGHRGFFHESGLYGSNEELVSIVVPFLEGAVQAGEPAVAALSEANTQLVAAAVTDPSHLWFVDGDKRYAKPAGTIKAFQELLTTYVGAGAHQVRIVAEVPHPGLGQPWDWWCRYEAVANHAFDDFPLWGLCLYDTRIAAPHVLADVSRTHPYTATADGRHLTNTAFVDPADFVARRPRPAADPIEATPAVTDLIDPTPAAARRAVVRVASGSDLEHADVDDLVYAVNEVVTNGIRHGRAPVRLRLWTAPDRIVAAVSDRGHGPAHPFAGMLPTGAASPGGLGLWLAHELCSHVTFDRTDEGFTIRLTAGAPRL